MTNSTSEDVVIQPRRPSDATFEAVGFHPLPGAIQILMAVYIPGKGYLATRRGMIYGGRHGEPPMVSDPDKAWEIAAVEVQGGLRALSHRHALEVSDAE